MAFVDPQWPKASEWLKSASENPRLSVIGARTNQSVTPGSYNLAPPVIRAALTRYSTYDFDSGLDLADLPVKDFGDTDGLKADELQPAFQSGVTCILGGDNGATRAGVQALASSLGVGLSRIGLITLDAHLDLRSLSFGRMNGNPIRGLIQDGLPGGNIHQIGLQSFANSAHYARDGFGFGIHQPPMGLNFLDAVREALSDLADRTTAIYLDIDLDVLDLAFVPGCPGARPGGITPRELRQAARICGRHLKVRCADIVEFDPGRDVLNQTALLAAVVFLEFACGVQQR